MFVGGLEASAGGNVGTAGSAVGLVAPLRGDPRDRNHTGLRAVSGAVHGRDRGSAGPSLPRSAPAKAATAAPNNTTATRFAGASYAIKTAGDRLLAGLGVLTLAPLLLLLAVLVRCTSRGPAIYVQERIGRHGKPFRMVKFRSMVVGADGRIEELADRNAPTGRCSRSAMTRGSPGSADVLRRFSLDELPQLFNVLTGSMSLVGPRPPLPGEVASTAPRSDAGCWSSRGSPACGRSADAATCPGRTRCGSTCSTSTPGHWRWICRCSSGRPGRS